MNTKKILGYGGLFAVVTLVLAFAACEDPTSSLSGKTLAGITLNTDSVKKTYIQNEALNLDGLVVTANYSDGSSAAVANYTASPANGATLSETGSTTVTVSYTEGTLTETAGFSVSVADKTLTGITAVYTGTKTIYTFTLLDSLKDHLTVTPQYSDGSDGEPLDAEDYELSGTLTAGTSTITVSYEGKETTFDVTVSDATLSSITVAFNQNDAIIYASALRDSLKQYLTVTATYSDNATATLTASEYTLSGELSAGTPAITVTYGDKTQTFTPDVTAVVLESITAQFNGTAIYTSTPLDNLKQYLTVTAVYNDGNQETLDPEDYELSGDLTIAGTPEITVTYEGKTATFQPTVTAVALAGITLNTATVKKAYNLNQTLDLTGLAVTANYNDGSSEAATGYTASPANGAPLSTAGQITVTVSYSEGAVTKTANFIVNVTDPNAVTPGLYYTLITEGENANTYSVSQGSVTSGAVVIPATYSGLPVTEIGYYGFYQINITSVTIPASVKIIGDYAFQFCSNLTAITIPNSVTSIGIAAFGRTSLTGNLTIPESVTSIGYFAFHDCTGLTSVTISADGTSVAGNAFDKCTSIATVTFAEGSESISDYHWSGLASVTSVNIPASVTEIGEYAFSSSGLTSINVNANNPNYASQNGILYNKAQTTLIKVPRGISGSFTIPDSVTSIDNSAFSGCNGLTSITTPNVLLTPCYALLV